MAKKTQVLFVDDLDSGVADETVAFSLDGKTYEIDLSGENALGLRGAMQIYVDAARTTSNGKVKRTRKARAGSTMVEPVFSDGAAPAPELTAESRTQIREWARSNGHQIGDRGRISETILAEYAAAH